MRRTKWVWILLFTVVCVSACVPEEETPQSTVEPGPEFIVDFETTAGTFAVFVHPEWAPAGAERFRELVTSGFYDDQRVFRVVPGFVAQWGLSGEPDVSAEWKLKTIADDPVVESNRRSYVTFAASTSPNSRTTQVFINTSDNRSLDAQGFAPFGQVVTGMDAVDAFNADAREEPSQTEILAQGNAYLDRSFPNLTQITSATIRDESVQN